MSNESFWLVWNENGHAPTFKHPSRQHADDEAIRLARQVKGQKFVVLASVNAWVVDDLKHIDMRDYNDDGIPF